MTERDTLHASHIVCILLVLNHVVNVATFDVTLLHTNDVHSRVEQFNKYGNKCTASDAAEGKCFGGVARLQTLVNDIRGNVDNVLMLDAGDQFLGSLWFNLYKGLASSFFMNRLQYDVMCFGNHEFDLGVPGLIDFLDNITFPIIGANTEAINSSPLIGRFEKSANFTVGGEQVVVVGYITPNTASISQPGANIRFGNVVEAVQGEVTRLTNQGINKIIALGHAGYSTDLEVAQIEGVDVVIGGHTNTFLYNGDPPSNEDPTGPYPTVVTRPSGQKALVIQAYTWGKYLGYINVSFNNQGELEAWSGNPVLLDNTIQEDPTIRALVDQWAISVNELNDRVVGSSKVFLNGDRKYCRTQECNMGNLILDAVIDYHLNFTHPDNTWAPAAIAVWNGGGIRASMDKGEVTLGSVMTVLPFNNEVDLLKVKGSVLRQQLEHAVRDLDIQEPEGKFLQVSGLRVVYDIRPVEKRVISVDVRCLECDVPSYSPLDDNEEYMVLTNGYIADGGDGFDFQAIERFRFSTQESTALSSYFNRHSPVVASLEGRITYKNPNDDDDTSGSPHTSASVTFVLGLMTFASIFYIH